MKSFPASVTFGRCFLHLFKTTCAIKKYNAVSKKIIIINLSFLHNSECCVERLTGYLVASWCDLIFFLQTCAYLCLYNPPVCL